MDEAGERCHGTTRHTPLALFALEAPLLPALPGQAPDLGTWHCVSLHRNTSTQPKSGSYPVAGNTSGGLKGPSVGAILSLT